MAYGLKYRSNFYNYFKKLIEVEISKQDYSGAVTDLRNCEVSIEVNYQDNNTTVIGTGCRVVVVNQGTFTSLEDLLTSTEKQFKCVIKYDGTTVFQGFSICDLNEQQFLPWSKITLQFTDYLRRLEGHFADNFFIGSNTDLLTMVQELIVSVGFGAAYEFYLNSTLIHSLMVNDGGATKTFLPQTYVENNMFFSDPNTYDDVYVAVNKALKPFGCFLYSAGDKWIMERHEDITRDKNTSTWVKYSLYQVASTVDSLKQELNKQAGDFKYVEESQILGYESGLQKLILNLKDKQFDTYVFNDYDITMSTVNETFPSPGTLQYRTWYAYQDILLLQRGFDYKGISSFIKWTYPPSLNDQSAFAFMGLYYAFQVQFNKSPEEPIILNVNYKMGGEIDMTPALRVDVNFIIRIDGGPYSGYFLFKILLPNGTLGVIMTGTFVPEALNKTTIDVSVSADKVWSVSESFNLTDATTANGITFTSVWDLLGNPDNQKFMIYFLPSIIFYEDDPYIFRYNRINYLGDVEVTITSQKIINKITYYINEDFVKTEEQDIEFWDLDNANFANGLMYGLGGIGNDVIGKTTEEWVSEKTPTPDALMDIYASNKFRNYAKTIHKLKGRILYDGYIKPLAVLTDDNRAGIEFILQGYTWDLNAGIYDIIAEEYTEEDISIVTTEDPAGDSSGNPYTGDPGVVPAIPSNLTVTQPVAGSSINLSWDASTGATSYILQRQPYFGPLGTWLAQWINIYEGWDTSYIDAIQGEMLPDTNMQISYRILAKTTEVFSAYSSTETILWTN
jgi:hypothetical protein